MSTLTQLGDKWRETFDANETWIAPTNAVNGFTVTNLKIICWGGGGGGGTATVNGGGGGGGGAYSQINSFAVTPGSSYTVVRGAGGAGNGGDTYFSSTGVAPTSLAQGCLAKGGVVGANGAIGGPGAGGAGGATGTGFGDVKTAGGPGKAGSGTSGGGGGGSGGDTTAGGTAGSGVVAGAAGTTNGAPGGRGADATNASAVGGDPGGGGGGASATLARSNGDAGRVVIEYNRLYTSPVGQTVAGTDGTNLVDGTFESGTESWAGANFTYTNPTTQPRSGARSLQALCNNAGTNRFSLSAVEPVTAGVYYEVEAWIRSAVTARLIQPGIQWYSDSGGTTLVSSLYMAPFVDSTSVWTQIFVPGVAPAGAVSMRLSLTYATLALNEVHYVDDHRVLAYTVAPVDSIARSVVGFRSVAEAVSAVTETVSRQLQANRSVTENAGTTTDTFARHFQGARSISEAVSAPTDGITRSYTGSRAIAESILAPTEAVNRSLVMARTVNEAIGAPTEALTRLFVGARTVQEALAAPTETIARSLTMVRAIVEAVYAADKGPNQVTGTFEGGTIENWTAAAFTLTNSAAQARSGTKSLRLTSDNINSNKVASSELFSVVGGATYEASSWHFPDFLLRQITPVFLYYSDVGGTISAGTQMGPAVIESPGVWTQAAIVGVAPAGAVSARYALIYGNSNTGEIHYIDDVGIAVHGWARQVIAARVLVEAIAAPTEAVTRSFVGSRLVAESILAPTDAISRSLAQARTIQETIEAPTELVERVATANRAIAENIAASFDLITRQAFFNRAIAELIVAVIDQVDRQTSLMRSIDEFLSAPFDAVDRVGGFNREIAEVLPGEAVSTGSTIIFAILD